MVDLIGALAAVMTTGAFLPQVVRTWKTRDVEGLSIMMYLCFCLGVALWFIYGILLDSWPLCVANGVTLALALFILAMKLLWGKKRWS